MVCFKPFTLSQCVCAHHLSEVARTGCFEEEAMASAVLRLRPGAEQSLAGCCSSYTLDTAKAEVGPLMSFGCASPPPQLPQIPANVWADVWNGIVEVIAKDVLVSQELRKLLLIPCTVICCHPCFFGPLAMTR